MHQLSGEVENGKFSSALGIIKSLGKITQLPKSFLARLSNDMTHEKKND